MGLLDGYFGSQQPDNSSFLDRLIQSVQAGGYDPYQGASNAPLSPIEQQMMSMAGPNQPLVGMTPQQQLVAGITAPQMAAAGPSPAPVPNNPGASPIAIGGYMMPRIGDAAQYVPSADDASVPTNAQPTQGQVPQSAQPAAQPTFMQPQNSPGGFGGALRGALSNMQAGPLGIIGGALAGGMGMGQGSAQDQQRRALQQSYNSYLAAGFSPEKAQLMAVNPKAAEKLIEQQYPTDQYSVVQDGENELGQKHYSVFNKADGTRQAIGPSMGSGGSGALGDMTKTGAEYLATLPRSEAAIVQQMVEGKMAPPTSFALGKPIWANRIAAARNVDPNFDETTWKSRAAMGTDLGKSSNSSIGGIISNGKSAFEHLATLSDKAAALGNYDGPNFPGGSYLAGAANAVGNSSSANAAKVSALNDASLKYGQESTKFYAGSGGGEAERMEARKVMNGSASSATMVGFLQSEKELMLGRLKQKEDQIRDVMGADYLSKHPVMTPDLQKTIDRIDQNINKLKGNSEPEKASTPGQTKTGVSWSVVQ